MGDQCVNIARLVPLSGYESPRDEVILEAIDRMGQIVLSLVSQAQKTFVSRNVELAQELVRQDAEVDRLEPRDSQARSRDRR